MRFVRLAQKPLTSWPSCKNPMPGTRYHWTTLTSPVCPEHASVIDHQRAKTEGGSKAFALGGSGAVIKLHAARPQTTTNATKIVGITALDHCVRGLESTLIHKS